MGRIEEYNIKYYSQNGGIITSAQKTKVITEELSKADEKGIFVIPGGMGTRTLIKDENFLKLLKEFEKSSEYTLSICTGSAVLAKCGILDGKNATSNKIAFDWVKSVNEKVNWIEKARWVVDGKFYTASGVSAGIDMTLGFICDRFGHNKAQEIADKIEYIWNEDSTKDLFAKKQ